MLSPCSLTPEFSTKPNSRKSHQEIPHHPHPSQGRTCPCASQIQSHLRRSSSRGPLIPTWRYSIVIPTAHQHCSSFIEVRFQAPRPLQSHRSYRRQQTRLQIGAPSPNVDSPSISCIAVRSLSTKHHTWASPAPSTPDNPGGQLGMGSGYSFRFSDSVWEVAIFCGLGGIPALRADLGTYVQLG